MVLLGRLRHRVRQLGPNICASLITALLTMQKKIHTHGAARNMPFNVSDDGQLIFRASKNQGMAEQASASCSFIARSSCSLIWRDKCTRASSETEEAKLRKAAKYLAKTWELARRLLSGPCLLRLIASPRAEESSELLGLEYMAMASLTKSMVHWNRGSLGRSFATMPCNGVYSFVGS